MINPNRWRRAFWHSCAKRRLAVGHFRLLDFLGADFIVAFRERSEFAADAKRIADGAERALGVFEAERTERLQRRHRQLVSMALA
jgi:hypothetical protein